MNIREAKDQIKNAIIAYRAKDAYGRPALPLNRQRPVFLLGAPGIGKTAIMEQIAQELSLPLVSYSMTHHTRQSALGLPFIREEEFDGQTFRVSEYTMSEIIAAVYHAMRDTGAREGILFLDEINCVSETLAPAMLQFLQYKVFGQHKVPEGWIVVTAGNPPEYNDSVREFDMATWDRLKRIDVEPDYAVWREYAIAQNVHPAVLSFLDIRKADFYRLETNVDGKRFVTPRGWIDLSDMIRLYEAHDLKVDQSLIGQYLQSPEVAKQFAVYYDLWRKYRSDYQVPQILNGSAAEEILVRARNAKFDERIALIGLLLDGIREALKPAMEARALLESAQKPLREARMRAAAKRLSLKAAIEQIASEQRASLDRMLAGGMLSRDDEQARRAELEYLRGCAALLTDDQDAAGGFAVVKQDFDGRAKNVKKEAAVAGRKLDNLFKFAEDAFGEGQEMLILVTELTASPVVSRFIGIYGCEAYFRHNKELLFYERQLNVIREIEALEGLDD